MKPLAEAHSDALVAPYSSAHSAPRTASGLRAQVWLWSAQRLSAAVLALCVVVHLVTMIYAVRNGLSATEVLGRTSGSAGWATFYAVFVAAVSIHASIGLRNVLAETFRWRGGSLEVVTLAIGVALALWGWRSVYAVVTG